ncbi:MAG: serine kinase [Tissierellia bacterium]|nr:serine kinase [Tissierellia bacterium]
MDSSQFAEILQLKPLHEGIKNIEVKGVYIGDLLSIVMSKAKENYVWITIQTHMNIVAVAQLLDLSCIIVVEGMEVEKDTLEKAKELGIPIFSTTESAYQLALRLSDMGIK